jgi:hypothetical protein
MSLQIIVKENKLPSLALSGHSAVEEADQEIGQAVFDDAYEHTVVATGNLQGSLFIETDEDGSTTIGYGADYAPDVELGTMFQPARPALGPAFDAHATEQAIGHLVQRKLAQRLGGL